MSVLPSLPCHLGDVYVSTALSLGACLCAASPAENGVLSLPWLSRSQHDNLLCSDPLLILMIMVFPFLSGVPLHVWESSPE